MKLLADAHISRAICGFLESAGHDCVHAELLSAGLPDEELMRIAVTEQRIVLTPDKGFGELVFRRRQKNRGVVLLRLSGLTQQRKAAIAVEVFADRAPDFPGCFAVVTEKGVRVRRQA